MMTHLTRVAILGSVAACLLTLPGCDNSGSKSTSGGGRGDNGKSMTAAPSSSSSSATTPRTPDQDTMAPNAAPSTDTAR